MTPTYDWLSLERLLDACRVCRGYLNARHDQTPDDPSTVSKLHGERWDRWETDCPRSPALLVLTGPWSDRPLANFRPYCLECFERDSPVVVKAALVIRLPPCSDLALRRGWHHPELWPTAESFVRAFNATALALNSLYSEREAEHGP